MDKIMNDLPCDIISNLPDDVTQILLMYLPTRDAIRTSILSRKWRYSWTKLPQLILDETLWNELIITHSARITFMSILYKLLLLHKGPIYKFTLSIPGLENCHEIDSLIFFLIRNGIEDLTLHMPDSECYKLPLSLLTCQQLKHLSLESCLIMTTPAFKGFGKLITLKLCEVTISNEALERLISNLPFLEVLELKNYCDIYDLEMDVPNLRTFKVEGLIVKIAFIKAPLLASLSINQYYNEKNTCFEELCNVLFSFPACSRVSGPQLFAFAGGVPRKLQTDLVFLKHIKLSEITLDRLDELSIILCLMRNSPNLKSVDIQILTVDPHTNVAMEILKEEEKSDVMLNELKEVKLHYITGTIVELEFIKLLLAKSSTLREMLIKPWEPVTDKKGFEILTQVTRFRRASKDAQVIYMNSQSKLKVEE